MENYSLFSSFLIGLLHVLEPCEDKAIASLFVAWAGRGFKKTLFLIFLYGLGMIIVNTLLGFLASFLGIKYLEEFQPILKKTAGLFTIIFGVFIISKSHLLEAHCHIKMLEKVNPKDTRSVLGFGLLRGLPLCPIELGIMLWAASRKSLVYGTFLVFAFSVGTALSLVPFALGAKGVLAILERRLGKNSRKLLPPIAGLTVSLIGILMFFERI